MPMHVDCAEALLLSKGCFIYAALLWVFWHTLGMNFSYNSALCVLPGILGIPGDFGFARRFAYNRAIQKAGTLVLTVDFGNDGTLQVCLR